MRLRHASLIAAVSLAACASAPPQGDADAATREFLARALLSHGVSDVAPLRPVRKVADVGGVQASSGSGLSVPAGKATAAPTPLVPAQAAPVPASAVLVRPLPPASVTAQPAAAQPQAAQASQPIPAPVTAPPVVSAPTASSAPTAVPAAPVTPAPIRPAPVVAARPLPPLPPPTVFHTRPGGTLDGTLRDWAKGQGWTVLVRTRRVWDIAAAADFPGDFKEAASGLVRALAGAVPAPVATFYANRVLVITSQDVTDD